MKRGKFVTFEGCEGVGKSTQLQLLRQYLEGNGIQAIYIREPGSTQISEKIRGLILDIKNSEMTKKCEVMLYCAARAQLIQQVISPALAEGKLVICDRYSDSTFAYQGFARGLGVEYINSLSAIVCGDCIPDTTIFLDMHPEKAFGRKGGADKDDRLEQETADFHKKVYEGYKLAQKTFSNRIVSIAAEGEINDINLAIIKCLKDRGVID